MGKLEEYKEQRAVLYKKLTELDKAIESLANAQRLFEEGEDVCFVDQFGSIQCCKWGKQAWSDIAFVQGHIFKTEKEAKLEAKRRNLLTRFRAFRDECNGDWKINSDNLQHKYFIAISNSKLECYNTMFGSYFPLFGYFENKEHTERAIELFGDEIKALYVDCEED